MTLEANTNNEASGGRVWQPKEEEAIQTHSLGEKIGFYLIFVSWAALIVMIVHAYIFYINFPAQKTDVFTEAVLYGEEWEFITVVAIFIILAVSLYLWSLDFVVTFLAAAFTFVLFTLLVLVIPTSIFQGSSVGMNSTEWLKDKQHLSFIKDIDIPMSQIADGEKIVMQGDDKKIYSVTFKRTNDDLSITKKVIE